MNSARPRVAPSARAAAVRAAIAAFLNEQYEPVTRADVAAGAGVSPTAAFRWLPELADCVNASEARAGGRMVSLLWVGR
jgi:AcrR family transcriptional regulator